MKYMLSSVKKPVATFDVNQAMEALTAQIGRVSEAYEGLVAAQGQCDECAAVISDCEQALESISKFGIAKENMSLLEGGDNRLDAALGLETLMIDSIESLSKTTKDALQKKYEAGLEGAVTEYWNKLLDMLKKLWAWVKRFFAELIDRNAKYIRLVKEQVTKFGQIDENAKVKVIDLKKINEAIAGAKGISDFIGTAVTTAKDAGVSAIDFKNSVPDAIKKIPGFEVVDGQIRAKEFSKYFAPNDANGGDLTLAQRGWTSSSSGDAARAFVRDAVTSTLIKSLKDIDAAYKELINKLSTESQNPVQAAEDKKREAAWAKDKLAICNSYVVAYGKLVGVAGSTLLKVVAAQRKEEK